MSERPSARKINRQRVDHLDACFKALSHRTRRQILMTLKHMGGEMTAGEIASRYSCAWPTITKHLKVLQGAGLVRVKREGNHWVYQLSTLPLKAARDHWLKHLED